jgi:hypothetical protein
MVGFRQTGNQYEVVNSSVHIPTGTPAHLLDTAGGLADGIDAADAVRVGCELVPRTGMRIVDNVDHHGVLGCAALRYIRARRRFPGRSSKSLRRALAGREDVSRFWILPEGEGCQVPPLSADILSNA